MPDFAMKRMLFGKISREAAPRNGGESLWAPGVALAGSWSQGSAEE